MSTPADHVLRLLLERELRALRLITWVRLAIVCVMTPTAWVLSQGDFDRTHTLWLLAVYALITIFWAWCIHQRKWLRIAGLTGALFDILMLAALVSIWHRTLGGDTVPPGIMLKSSLTELSLFFVALNALTLRALYPMVVTAGAIMIHVVILFMAWSDPRTQFTGQYLRAYTTGEIAYGRVTTGLIILALAGTVLTLMARRSRKMIIEASELQKDNDQLGRYFSPGLVEKLVEKPELFQVGGERRTMSFLFTDLQAFTRMVENGEPGELVSALNGYLDEIVRVAFRHEGVVDKVVGDSIRVFFGAPLDQPDHACRAVNCALEISRVSEEYRRRMPPGLGFGMTRIGVNTGQVIVGNFGGDALFDYTAHGNAINIAARLEAANKITGTRILVSEETRRHCETLRGRPAGRFSLRGLSQPVTAFEPLENGTMTRQHAAAYLAAYQALGDETDAAARLFAGLHERYPEDALAGFYHRRLSAGMPGTLIAG